MTDYELEKSAVSFLYSVDSRTGSVHPSGVSNFLSLMYNGTSTYFVKDSIEFLTEHKNSVS